MVIVMIRNLPAAAKLVAYVLAVTLVALQPEYGGQPWYRAALAVAGALAVYGVPNRPAPPKG